MTPEELAKYFPQYEIMNLIGRGGMGSVYRARQKSLDRTVAIKTILEADDDPAFAERFVREARALARLSHPNIVTIHDFGHTDSLYFLVMEYVDGVNLRQAINANAFDPSDALRIVGQVCEALQYAHAHGVVHRDIKPENILLNEDGNVKIADFGLAKMLDENHRDITLTGTRQIVGTLAYMAPEQIDNSAPVDHRADIYSLGVVFYELLTGHLPLGRFEPPSQRGQGIDQRVDPVVMKTLSRLPADRYQAATELSGAMAPLRQPSSPQPASPQTTSPQTTSASPVSEHNTPQQQTHQPQPATWPDPYVESLPPHKENAWAATPTFKPSPTSAAHRIATIPFKCDSYGGFASAHGLMHFEEGALRIEWKDKLLDMFDTDVRVVSIPWGQISRMQMTDYLLTVKLKITASSMEALHPLPTKNGGTASLTIARGDMEPLQRWLAWFNSHVNDPTYMDARGLPSESALPRWTAEASQAAQAIVEQEGNQSCKTNTRSFVKLFVVGMLLLAALKLTLQFAERRNISISELVGFISSGESEAIAEPTQIPAVPWMQIDAADLPTTETTADVPESDGNVDPVDPILTLTKAHLPLDHFRVENDQRFAVFRWTEEGTRLRDQWLASAARSAPEAWPIKLGEGSTLELRHHEGDEAEQLRSTPLSDDQWKSLQAMR